MSDDTPGERFSTGALKVFAVAPPGLERFTALELAALGIRGTVREGGVEWTGDAAQMRRANLHLRTAGRVLVRLGEFRARTFFELERHAGRLPWSRYLRASRRVLLRVSSRKSKLYHERAIAERLYRAIADAAGGTPAAESDEEREGEGAQLFVIRVVRDEFVISADASGALLHRRGYRQEIARAPLRENIAAAMLLAARWTGSEPLLDPFCGSGTIPIESALIARNIAPGLASAAREARAFAFEHWPEHDAQAWQDDIVGARAQIRRVSVPIVAADRDAGALRAARANAERAGVEHDIEWALAPLARAPAPAGPGALVTNPPYGVRVTGGEDLRDLYAALGHYIREHCVGWSIALLSADIRLERQLGVPLEVAAETRNGGIAVRLLTTRG